MISGRNTTRRISHRKLLLGITVGCGLLFCIMYKRKATQEEDWIKTRQWLKTHHLEKWSSGFQKQGLTSQEELGTLLAMQNMQENTKFSNLPTTLQGSLESIQESLAFSTLLKAYKLDHLEKSLKKQGMSGFTKFKQMTEDEIQAASVSDSSLSDYVQLKYIHKNIDSLQRAHVAGLYNVLTEADGGFGLFARLIFFTLTACVGTFVYNKWADLLYALRESHQNQSLYRIVSGHCLSLDNTQVEWQWTSPHTVGKTFSFCISFFYLHCGPFSIENNEKLRVEITNKEATTPAAIEVLKDKTNTAKVTFTVHQAGQYKVSLMYEGRHIRGSPFYHDFLPGEIKPANTAVVGQAHLAVATVGIPHQLYIEPRDEYNNKCLSTDYKESDIHIAIKDIKAQYLLNIPPKLLFDKSSRRIVINIKIPKEGVYSLCVKYQKSLLKNGESTLIVLSGKDMTHMNKSVNGRRHDTYYEAHLLSRRTDDKHRKVYCYISPRQLVIKEFFMKIFPKRLHTFRVNPYTSFSFLGYHNQYKKDMMSITDGCEGPVFIVSSQCNLIAATYAAHVNKNIGGSETFSDKRDFFYSELRDLHRKRAHSRQALKINRFKLLESSIKATKEFSTSDWCRNFEITFIREEGLDWGGLRREWFELLCTELFEKSGLFVKLSDDSQSLYHPNASRPHELKLKYYEFAGRVVGKCVYESALGSSYRQLVKARFTRSFLAQLIGLRVHYKYFEQDDPELYKTKIVFIAENDVDDMDLTFSEELYVDGRLQKVVDLVENGSEVAVNSGNKLRYLDALAQYRLVTGVKDEITAFLKGFNELVPDQLLCMFDENELELLLCGTDNYSVSDLQAHHVVAGGHFVFSRTMQRFWTIIAGFTNDDMARLVQFITGCSQLPPGGFGDLKPLITFSPTPSFGKLPTAHTCFNQLCLPEYHSIEEMHQALLTAITEGNQGFLLV